MTHPDYLMTAYQAAAHLGITVNVFHTHLLRGRLALAEATVTMADGQALYDRAALDYDLEIMTRQRAEVTGWLYTDVPGQETDLRQYDCPQCGARAWRGCRTSGGNPTRTHSARRSG